jgi:hypothetical protein
LPTLGKGENRFSNNTGDCHTDCSALCRWGISVVHGWGLRSQARFAAPCSSRFRTVP